SEPEAPATEVSISALTPCGFEADTAAKRLTDLPRSLATAIINRRLAILAKKENAPFSAGRTNVNESYDLFREASIDLTCKADQWSAALGVADQELRRALAHGFSSAELREITANFVNSLEQAVKTAPTRRSGQLASSLVSSLNDREVFTHPAAELALYKPVLEKITPAEAGSRRPTERRLRQVRRHRGHRSRGRDRHGLGLHRFWRARNRRLPPNRGRPRHHLGHVRQRRPPQPQAHRLRSQPNPRQRSHRRRAND
ncbi:MAG: hypothetical protein EBU32_12845, partial [Opitutaceae bacterium]|nr:hypothetical protein [Opitutaceae bacterium]